MVRRHHSAKPANGAGENFQIAVLGEIEAYSEIGLTIGDGGLDFGAGIEQRQAQLDPWIADAEFLYRARHQVRGEPAHHRDRDLAAPQSLQLFDLALRARQLLEGLANVADQDFAGRGQDQLLRQPVKNRRSQLSLERQYLAADRGCRHIQMARRLANGSGSGNFVDVVQ